MSIIKIKNLREKTGAGIVEIKKSLEEAQGDEKKALEILKINGQKKAMKKSERSAQEGLVVSYIHSNKKVGAIVKIYCETDFVAMNDEFKELAQDIAMHITAMNPKFIHPDDVPQELIEKEKKIWEAQISKDKKPKEIREKIMKGKEEKFREEISLISQPFVKNPEITIKQLVSQKIAKIGENIQIGDFSRMEL